GLAGQGEADRCQDASARLSAARPARRPVVPAHRLDYDARRRGARLVRPAPRGLGHGAGGRTALTLRGYWGFATAPWQIEGQGGNMAMIKSELVQRISSQNPHLYQRDVENIVNAILGEIVAAMARGDRVELRGFGAFSVKNRPARTGRNPRTGAHV